MGPFVSQGRRRCEAFAQRKMSGCPALDQAPPARFRRRSWRSSAEPCRPIARAGPPTAPQAPENGMVRTPHPNEQEEERHEHFRRTPAHRAGSAQRHDAHRPGLHPMPARAQDFSGRPIRMLVGLAAGGATDVMARIVAQKMSREPPHPQFWSRTRPAAGTAFPAVRRPSPARLPTVHAVLHIDRHPDHRGHLLRTHPFDLTKLYAGHPGWRPGPLILVVRQDRPITNVAALVAFAKANPG